ncbi:MAG: hypothetical protein KH009_08280 [Clostridiales bacterium]|nr:hypothetical protein [Clostridiales bacterium]
MNARRSRIGLLLGISLVLLTGSWYWQGMDRTFPAPRLNLFEDYVQRQCRLRGLDPPGPLPAGAERHEEIYLQDGRPVLLVFQNARDSFQTLEPLTAEPLTEGVSYLFTERDGGPVLYLFLLDSYSSYARVDQVVLSGSDGTGLGVFVDHELDGLQEIGFKVSYSVPVGAGRNDVQVDFYDRWGEPIQSFLLSDPRLYRPEQESGAG